VTARDVTAGTMTDRGGLRLEQVCLRYADGDGEVVALDHERALEIVSLLVDETHRHQIATLMVTHDRPLARLADRVLEMHDGRLRPAGALAER